MNSERAILLRYHEVALKGGNRTWFESRLAENTRRILKRTAPEGERISVRRENTRIVVEAPWNPTTQRALTQVFGITGFSAMRIVPTELDSIVRACIEELEERIAESGMPRSFRVTTRRSEKALPDSSHEIDRKVGSAIQARYPALPVDLENPEATISLEVRRGQSYLWLRKQRGPGGLPVGSNGRLLALMSGGLDSPIAAIRALKRGSPLSFVHFYGGPFVDATVLDKISDLIRVVNRFQPDPEPFRIVHFGKIQEKIALVTPSCYRTVLYRRLMIRIAEALARQIGAKGLVTGESVGQVASQTIENLSVINSVARLPVLRPLISFDKDEIIDEARRLGTFEISIRPAIDCCTLFTDRKPVLRPTLEEIETVEAKYSVEELVKEALANTEIRMVP